MWRAHQICGIHAGPLTILCCFTLAPEKMSIGSSVIRAILMRHWNIELANAALGQVVRAPHRRTRYAVAR
jgi:hypothetical protein